MLEGRWGSLASTLLARRMPHRERLAFVACVGPRWPRAVDLRWRLSLDARISCANDAARRVDDEDEIDDADEAFVDEIFVDEALLDVRGEEEVPFDDREEDEDEASEEETSEDEESEESEDHGSEDEESNGSKVVARGVVDAELIRLKPHARRTKTLDVPTMVELNRKGAHLAERPGVDYHVPQTRAECEVPPKHCPWCDEVVVMAVIRPGPEDPVAFDGVRIACPTCEGRVQYEPFVGEPREGAWRWTRHAPGDPVDLRGLAHARPCILVRCRHNLYLEIKEHWRGAAMQLNFPEEGPEGLVPSPETPLVQSCSLDVADAGDHTLEEVGELMNLTRERVRQIEEAIFRKIRASAILRSMLPASTSQDER